MFKISRILLIYAIAVPLAVLLGYLVVSPGNFTYMVIGLVLFVFALPILIRWHHTLLIVFWCSCFNCAFLPGQPDLWLVFAALSFTISMLNHIMFQKHFLSAPEMTRSVLFLAAVILITAWIRGGIGIRVLGGATFGGRYYIFELVSILGYFAFTAEPIAFKKRTKMAVGYFAGGLTPALSNVIYVIGPGAYFLYYIIPSAFAINQAASDNGTIGTDRITGLGAACVMGVCILLGLYGVRGIFDLRKPWRSIVFGLLVVACGFSGFRSILITLIMVFAFHFYLEGLMRTHLLPILLLLVVCCLGPAFFFPKSLPGSVQRAISFLPVNVDSEILSEAKGSSEWRYQMWNEVIKEIPRYLIIGKGYAINPEEIYAVTQAAQMGYGTSPYEGSMLAGDYHSGPLSLIIPFGIFGCIGFFAVLIAGGRLLYRNYRFGDSKLRNFNTVMLAYYIASVISFFFIFGAFNSELSVFLGLCGLSVSLNGGVQKRAAPRFGRAAVSRRLVPEPT